MNFADIHIHLLYETDDGAKSEEVMQEMLDAAYADGTRIICATPHFAPEYFGDNREKANTAYEKLRQYAKKYDDLILCRGNELRYSSNCFSSLKNGDCRTINGSRYLLVDFSMDAPAKLIVNGVSKLLNAGYVPILAHAERYSDLSYNMSEIRYMQECGALIQIDALSPSGHYGSGAKRRSRKLIEHYFADLIASDAHDVKWRKPLMSECYDYVAQKCGDDYARQIFFNNQVLIINDSHLGREMF